MGKSYKRNSPHKPKAHGKSFNKDQSWKDKKKQGKWKQPELTDYIPDSNEPNR